MTITVYSKNRCVQCNATYRALTNRGIDYTVVNLDTDADALERMTNLGYKQAPIVECSDGRMWAGFRPDIIATLNPELVPA